MLSPGKTANTPAACMTVSRFMSRSLSIPLSLRLSVEGSARPGLSENRQVRPPLANSTSSAWW